MPWPSGTRLGPYEVLSALGVGGMGEVYRAHDTKLHREVAIKVLLPAVANDLDRLARFRREAQLLASLNHPNIAAIFCSGSEGTLALVMELVEGPTLADKIAHAASPIVDLTPPSEHPMWRAMFPVAELPQMASINTWRRTGNVIERWNEDGSPPTARGIADEKGRLMVVMVHNTDLPDPWEREGEDKDYFFRFSPEAYAVGIDIVLYAMTH